MKGFKLLSKLLDPNKPDLKNITATELDALAEEVAHNYVNKWIRLRAVVSKTEEKELSDDDLYTAVMKYITDLCSTFNVTRMWTTEIIKTAIWTPLMTNHDLWDFIYRGYSEFNAKAFVHTTEMANVSRTALIKHIADGLSGFNNKEANDVSLELVPADLRAVLPKYEELVKLMEYNPWLIFIYYLSRLDLYEIIYGDSDE